MKENERRQLRHFEARAVIIKLEKRKAAKWMVICGGTISAHLERDGGGWVEDRTTFSTRGRRIYGLRGGEGI